MTYTADESDGVVTLMISVLEGSLDAEVVINLSTSDDSAVCKLMRAHGISGGSGIKY